MPAPWWSKPNSARICFSRYKDKPGGYAQVYLDFKTSEPLNLEFKKETFLGNSKCYGPNWGVIPFLEARSFQIEWPATLYL